MSPNIWRLILTGEVRVTDDFIGLCWETLGHGIHVSGHLRSPTYPNTVADRVHPLTVVGPIYLPKSKVSAVWQLRKEGGDGSITLHCQVCQGSVLLNSCLIWMVWTCIRCPLLPPAVLSSISCSINQNNKESVIMALVSLALDVIMVLYNCGQQLPGNWIKVLLCYLLHINRDTECLQA